MNKIIVAALLLVASRGLAQATLPLDPNMQVSTLPLYGAAAFTGQPLASAQEPTLTVFKPQGRGNGSAVVIAPGGGYIVLSSNIEGAQVAEWFAARGFTAFVLNYRLGPKNLYPIPLEDGLRAMRLVRSMSESYGFSQQRIGMVGFSAGGHLAAVVATVPQAGAAGAPDPIDRLTARPDFLVLGYPWLNAMEPQIKGKITYCSLVHGLTPAQCEALTEPYTPKRHVTKDAPPTFIYATSDDAIVPVQASVDFYQALLNAGASAEMHLFRHGNHGSGLGSGDAALDLWPGLLEAWLRDQGFLNPMRPSPPSTR